MEFYRKELDQLFTEFGSDRKDGLSAAALERNRKKFGLNKISERKPKSLFKRVIEALTEPMMLILCFAFVITLGINIGKLVKGGDANFYECLGIVIAIAISTVLTVVMEGKSQKAFKLLNKLGDDGAVRVVRGGEETVVPKTEVCVGDIIVFEAGDKVCADCRIISCSELSVDQSMLTGESKPSKKRADGRIKENASIAEITNSLFSGTFISTGRAVALVVNVGDAAETGKLAEDVLRESTVSAPLEEKLSRLGKTVTIFGAIAATLVFALSIIRLVLIREVNFLSVENAFVEAVVLIVAAVPEGLPTTVAISLTLNVVKLARSNALIKKLVATETVGCVSVICSDKTGTLTQNKMLVDRFVIRGVQYAENKLNDELTALNCAVNSTAILSDGSVKGSATEGALLYALGASRKDVAALRGEFVVEKVEPFSSDKKCMTTKGVYKGKRVSLLKGAPEKVLCECVGTDNNSVLKEISEYQKNGCRVLAFAHDFGGGYVFDGYAVMTDKLREDVKRAVRECVGAGVKIKILTGDNAETARNVAKELGLACSDANVVTADFVDGLSDEKLQKILPDISVIARSTPRTKLKVVKALQAMGEVVAVTGDGVNDAPAIKHADIGIAMGSGSEITKEAGDIVLLDDSFSTIIKAISFGRNVYGNFQRFITFQLTVNLASMSIIIACLLLGFRSPFTSTCLLWLNVIMDGPLALSLGLEQRPLDLSRSSPVRRGEDILSKKMMARIVVHSVFACVIVTLQKIYDFLGVGVERQDTVIITMFVFFQLFNAINCREVGAESVFKNFFSNKLFVGTFAVTMLLHVVLVELVPEFFGTVGLTFAIWLKILAVCSSILLFSEGYKLVYRLMRRSKGGRMAKIGVIDSKNLA